MDYIRINRKRNYESTTEPKMHILRPNGDLACGVGFSSNFEIFTEADPDKMCIRCLEAEKLKPMERKVSLKAFIVKIIKPIMDDCDFVRAKEALTEGCSLLEEQLKAFDVKCHFIIESEHANSIKGRIVLDCKRYMYLKFDYKPNRKERTKFEANTRDYLIQSVEDAFV
jgi:hypothetical protein